MFRDDLKAALARAEQLQSDLAKAQARAESSDEELSALRGRLAQQERELKKLHKGGGQAPPAGSSEAARHRRLKGIIVSVGLLTIAAVVVAMLLVLRSSSALPGAPTIVVTSPTAQRSTVLASPTIQLDKSAAGFRAFVETIPSKCSLYSTGWPSKCSPTDLRERLQHREEGVGTLAATLSYCSLLWAPREPVRRFAAHRLATMYRRALDSGSEAGFRCLDHFVHHGKAERRTAQAARAWAVVGGSLGRIDAIVAALDTLDRERRLAALRGLWKGGRLKALPHLAKVLATGNRAEGQAVLDGFGYEPWTEVERDALCPLLAKTMEALRNRRLAARTAYRLANSSCGRPFAERAFAQIAQQVDGDPRCDFWWVAAAGQLCSRRRAEDPVCAKALDLLERATRARALTDVRRGQALDQLRRMDLARARKVAASLAGTHGYVLTRAIDQALRVEKK